MTTPEAVVRSYLASFSTGDPDAVAAHVTDDFVNDHAAALGEGCEGRAEYRRRLPGFLATMVGLRYEPDTVLTDGTADAGRATATYRLTATVDGSAVSLRGAMAFELAEGRIARRTDYWDGVSFLRQTGQA